ncbi:Os03g0441350 [Oryza sativa Japonica Group]|uniref:Os03g0441350 protein n=1 Tax=Oryza sativa subsp. japonica TaxID=39947 RepID=A0A0P0VZ53_ORYSJ|nr:Os03g0441350 [Oryza sativa Japonica Group]
MEMRSSSRKPWEARGSFEFLGHEARARASPVSLLRITRGHPAWHSTPCAMLSRAVMCSSIVPHFLPKQSLDLDHGRGERQGLAAVVMNWKQRMHGWRD